MLGRLRETAAARWTPRSSLAFTLALAGLLVASSLAISLGWTAGLERVTAAAGARVCGLLGVDVWLRGADIVSEARTLRVGPECSILNFVAVFLALALATGTASLARRAWFSVGGVALIWIVDVTRLAVAALVAQEAPSAFDWLHAYVYPAVLTMMIAVLWIAWLRWGVADDG